ncbi:MAG TPA: hypothetical protein VKT52_03500, partial [Ktedonobacterales bacterium]|nr:hypothetical protein [Ktedonobacterales bacterium]
MSLFTHRNDAEASTPQTGTPNTRDQRRPRDREALIRQAELVISHVLRGGIVLSALIILAGVVWFYYDYFTASGRAGNAAFPHTLSGVGAGLAHGNP